jgi:hypothetical protein
MDLRISYVSRNEKSRLCLDESPGGIMTMIPRCLTITLDAPLLHCGMRCVEILDDLLTRLVQEPKPISLEPWAINVEKDCPQIEACTLLAKEFEGLVQCSLGPQPIVP